MYSSIIKKILMAISGVFLMIFLIQHLIINLTSLLPDNGATFNTISHFMGHNPIVQFILQPILIFGVFFHFIMGFILEFSNFQARKKKYIIYDADATWASKNMIISGCVILAFLMLHFYDFWIPEIDYKYIKGYAMDNSRYFHELQEKFQGDSVRTIIYCFSFILLGLHLNHGFSSSFQSMGVGGKQKLFLKKLAISYSVFVSFGFIIIALFHFF